MKKIEHHQQATNTVHHPHKVSIEKIIIASSGLKFVREEDIRRLNIECRGFAL
jgi:hypothetical protein